MRKDARAAAFKLVYEYAVVKERNADLPLFFEEDGLSGPADREYAERLYNGVLENLEELTAVIARYSSGFTVDRIFKADLAAMLLCAYELSFCPDVPEKAAINEAVELVKIYSAEKSVKFVNGVLASVLKEIKGV